MGMQVYRMERRGIYVSYRINYMTLVVGCEGDKACLIYSKRGCILYCVRDRREIRPHHPLKEGFSTNTKHECICVTDRRENPFVTKEQKIGMIAGAEGNAQIN